MDKINHDAPVPIYYQIMQDLKQKIVSGVFKPNDRIPSEESLAKQYGISRMTARNAVTQLVNEGFLYRVHGKGTFVSKPRVEKSFAPLTGFVEDMRAKGFVPGSKVLSFTEIVPNLKIRSILELDASEHVFEIIRLRYANAEPIVIQKAYVPSRFCPTLLEDDLESNSLYEILAKKYGLVLFKASQRMEAISATKEHAELLGIKRGKPLLFVKRTSSLENKIPVEYVEIWYRGDRYAFEVELFQKWDK
jgi:GntR family transcriptional regulator